MSNAQSYYPGGIGNRARWWSVIHLHAAGVLTPLGYPADRLASIVADAAWATYCYGTIHRFLRDTVDAFNAYEDHILNAPNGTAFPDLPALPNVPTPPTGAILAGIEARRILWVQEIKVWTGYNLSVGAQLGIETPASPFAPGTHVCRLSRLASNSPGTVSGTFHKANGNLDGINFHGRKVGTTGWAMLGRFNARRFTARVPLAGSAPEDWEFYAVAVKADVEFGQGSPIFPVIVRA